MNIQTTTSHPIVLEPFSAFLRRAKSTIGLADILRNALRVASIVSRLAILMMVEVAHGGQTNLPTIFVAPITGTPGLQSWRASIGESIADAVINQLASSHKYGVLETTTLESLRKEIGMGTDGWMEPAEKTQKGHWFGADYMLAGKVTHFERPSPGSGTGIIQGIPGLFGKRAKVQILWRIVNASTRKVVASGTADSTRARDRFSFGGATRRLLGGSEDGGEALERALDFVLVQIVSDVEALDLTRTERIDIVENQTKSGAPGLRRSVGTVEAVKPDFLIVGLGKKHGCKTGDKLDLCEVSEIKNSEGATVFKEEKVVGEVEIDMCIEDRSKARYSSLIAPKEGWVVRCKTPGGL